MTRINCIPVKELTREHLIAEYRELPRVIKLANKCKDFSDIPKDYVLGAGHVKFFYNKLGYLCNRYVDITLEMSGRGYKTNAKLVNDVLLSFTETPNRLMGDWKPTQQAQEINRQRIADRLAGK